MALPDPDSQHPSSCPHSSSATTHCDPWPWLYPDLKCLIRKRRVPWISSVAQVGLQSHLHQRFQAVSIKNSQFCPSPSMPEHSPEWVFSFFPSFSPFSLSPSLFHFSCLLSLSLYSALSPYPSVSASLYSPPTSVLLHLQLSPLSLWLFFSFHLFNAYTLKRTTAPSGKGRDSALSAWMSQYPQLQQSSSTVAMNDSIWSCFRLGYYYDTPVRMCGWGP